MDELNEEGVIEMSECLKHLNTFKEIPPSDANHEELKGDSTLVSTMLELKILSIHLKYVFLEPNGEKPIIISNSLDQMEEEKLIKVLQVHKEAIGWPISDLKGINPAYCMHKVNMESDYKLVAQPQRRLNPVMKEKVRKEVLKHLEAGMIYPISDNEWVIPVQVMPKKGGTIVITNEKNELENMHRLSEVKSSHKEGSFSSSLYGSNVEATGWSNLLLFLIWRCMLEIFADLVEKCITVFMDDFSIFGASYDLSLENLELVLKRFIETNLVLNWEKFHFMVQEGIVLGHKILARGIEVDKAKIDVIEKLPPPINVKGVRSFLGHSGIYRRFIKDFSKIAKPLCTLLNKDQPFSL
ncbi:uncharacterized protein LOC109817803 [Cajanus cajan]|uniref:uncharacterized protein LOC109817803 n=1 Tax=Cajanus cajan TaxID=3821 RepID=UPI00098DC46B|nr:uncharacterized protein LOC109817803 [Cajanus cajan]